MSPDYTNYSLDQLRTARGMIDTDRYPDRARDLDERIAALEVYGAAPNQPLPGADSAARAIIKRTGAVIALIGAAQLIASIAMSSIPGSVRLEVLNLIIGAVIYFGGFRAISVVRWLAWFSIAPLIGSFVNNFAFLPLDMTLTHLRLYPAQFMMLHGPLLLQIVLSVWTVRQLGHPALLAERAAAGRKVRDMRIPLALGVLAALAATWMMFSLLRGDDARRASDMAARQLGAGYRYHTSALHYMHGGGKTVVTANVAAWNENELISVPVRWEN